MRLPSGQTPFANYARWHIDNKAKQLDRRAVAQDYWSHADRWRKDDDCSRQCYENTIPQWLLYLDGTYAGAGPTGAG